MYANTQEEFEKVFTKFKEGLGLTFIERAVMTAGINRIRSEERARAASLHCCFCSDAPDDGSECNCHQKTHFLNPAAIPPEPRTCEHDWWTVSDANWVIRGARCYKCGEFVGGSIEQLAGKLKSRTCEMCATGCLPNERIYVNPDVETPCPGWTPHTPQVSSTLKPPCSKCSIMHKDCDHCGPPAWEGFVPLPAQSVDVEMVREARKYMAEIVRAANANEGYVSCLNAVSLATHALAALDRIGGKEE